MEGFLKTFDLVQSDVWMIAFSAIIFTAFYHLMKRSVFGPFLALIEARESKTEGAVSAAGADLKAAHELQRAFDEKIREARVEAIAQKAKQLEIARRESASILIDAESKAQDILKTERENLKKNVESLREATGGEMQSLVSLIVSKLDVHGELRQ